MDVILNSYLLQRRKRDGLVVGLKCDMLHKCDVTHVGLSQQRTCLGGIFLLGQLPINRLAADS
jgi:hypothetical protein